MEIKSALKVIELSTCVKFVERPDVADYIRFVHYAGVCASNVGRIGKGQPIYLDARACMTRGTIQHEVIHALGYDHMIYHQDRDKYIVIDFDNIHPFTHDISIIQKRGLSSGDILNLIGCMIVQISLKEQL